MTDDDALSVLVVEDDAATRTFLADNLLADGCHVATADSVDEAWRVLEARARDVAVVDVGLPDGSGLDLLRRVRGADALTAKVDPQLPVLLLSGRAADPDRLRGFERGADDFVAKPFAYNELLARIRVLGRRGQGVRPGRVRVGPIEIDPLGRDVTLGGEKVTLSAKEFALLRALAADPTRVWTKEELLRTVWGFSGAIGTTRTLDSHACRLRRKLGVHGECFVMNVWGIGYRLVDAVPVAVAPATAGIPA